MIQRTAGKKPQRRAVGAVTFTPDAAVGRALLLRVALPLALGVMTYVGRPTRPAALGSIPIAIFDPLHRTVGQIVQRFPIIAGVLPDVAWAFSLGSLLRLIGRSEDRATRAAWLCAGAVLSVGYELAQIPQWVPGTFDRADLAGSALAYALATNAISMWKGKL